MPVVIGVDFVDHDRRRIVVEDRDRQRRRSSIRCSPTSALDDVCDDEPGVRAFQHVIRRVDDDRLRRERVGGREEQIHRHAGTVAEIEL